MSNVSRGKLKLKKTALPARTSTSKVKKSRKPKDKQEKSKKTPKVKVPKEATEPVEERLEDPLAKMTPAERAYELAQRERKRKRVEKRAELSHTEKVNRFNDYLAKLSEHYDIPKVGPG